MSLKTSEGNLEIDTTNGTQTVWLSPTSGTIRVVKTSPDRHFVTIRIADAPRTL
jgi:hypothetical protein